MLTKTSLTIRLHPDDDVVIARQQLVAGTTLIDENVPISGLIPPGHKVATRAIAQGEPVRRYNQIIGFAKRPIAPGEHVHLHNLEMGDFARDYAFGVDAKPTRFVDTAGDLPGHRARRRGPGGDAQLHRHPVDGELLGDGRARRSPTRSRATRSPRFPNVDGVVALTHGSGCGMDVQGEGMQILRRTLGGYATHANFAGVLIIGLGCEANQINALLGAEKLERRRRCCAPSTSRTSAAPRRRSPRASRWSRRCCRSANEVQRETVRGEHI